MAKVGCDRDVDRVPPNMGFGVRKFHDAFVLGREAGLDSGVGDQCAILGDTGVLLVADGVLISSHVRQAISYERLFLFTDIFFASVSWRVVDALK
jgi:hypothetical protein